MKKKNDYEELKGDKREIIDTSDLENNEILFVKDDRLFHDLFNGKEISTIEWFCV